MVFDFAHEESYVRVIYNDGTIVEPLRNHLKGLKRKGLKSANVVVNGEVIHTLDIKGDKLIYRLRNIVHGLTGNEGENNWNNPKRCFVLGTKGKVAFVWDDGDIKEFKDWQKEEPYTKPQLTEDEQ